MVLSWQSHKPLHYHLGTMPVTRSTLSDVSDEGVLEDQEIQLSSPKAHIDCPIHLRRICFVREEDGKTLTFISNDFKRTAGEIVELYKQRWQIELFFKWIKQNLKIKCLAGRSENAVKTPAETT